MFNRLTKAILILSSCSVVGFKLQLDCYLTAIQLGFNNSLDGGNCIHDGYYADDLAAS